MKRPSGEQQRVLDEALDRAFAAAMQARPCEVRWVNPSSYARQLLGNELTLKLVGKMQEEVERENPRS